MSHEEDHITGETTFEPNHPPGVPERRGGTGIEGDHVGGRGGPFGGRNKFEKSIGSVRLLIEVLEDRIQSRTTGNDRRIHGTIPLPKEDRLWRSIIE
jgi:hypothetical protein